MNHRVNNTCYSVNSTDDCADTDQKLDEVLLILSNVFSDRAEFEVEKENRFFLSVIHVVGYLVV